MGPSWGSGGSFWRQVGALGDHFGSKSGVLGTMLAPSWWSGSIFGGFGLHRLPIWTKVGPSWGQVGPSWSYVGSSWLTVEKIMHHMAKINEKLQKHQIFVCFSMVLGLSLGLCWGHVGPILWLSKGARCILRSPLGQVGILLDLEGIGVPPRDFWYPIFGGLGWPS